MSRPEGKSVVFSIWIYKTQHAVYGSIVGYKARFVARGFSQKEGTDYEETFAQVTWYTSIISIHTCMRWEINQLDIKATFLNGVVKEELYVENPLGVETHDMQNHVCKLKKEFYELRKNPWDSTYSYTRILKIT